MNPTRTQAIAAFLRAKAHRDLAELYNHDMEVQVNVARGTGTRITQGNPDFKGKDWVAWTDGSQVWKPFRIPLHANTEPVYDDRPMNYSLEAHCEGIGLSGWDWKAKLSRWVAFDFDAIVGHSDKHSKKLTDSQLKEIEVLLSNIPFVTLRKSTSGKGLHLYIFLRPVATVNHTEHAALARSLLSMLSALTGIDVGSKVDVCGGNMWIWHRKMYNADGTRNDGLRLLKTGKLLEDVPSNWRDHLNVVAKRSRRSTPQFIYELDAPDPDRLFAELCGQRARTPLDKDHRCLIDWLMNNGAMWWWDNDNHMLITHTHSLKEAHNALNLRGRFETLATGADRGNDHNCFAFPVRGGAWAVRRYSLGIKESDSWEQDGQGWTRCYLNRDPDLHTLAKLHDGVEHKRGYYVFRHACDAAKVLIALCVDIQLPTFVDARPTRIEPLKNENKIAVSIKSEQTDDGNKMKGWLEEKGFWVRVFVTRAPSANEDSSANYDDLFRHLVAADEDAGWVVKRDGIWSDEPLLHVRPALATIGLSPKDINQVIGAAIFKPWRLVNLPFQPEYPGDREWNRGAAQFMVAPSTDLDSLSYPTWQRILNHCGSGINDEVANHAWCQNNGILNGADFLKLWIASMIQQPHKPTTYLALWGAQDSGKSIFHESISEVLFRNGTMRAHVALKSGQNFNGELVSAILAIIEETDFRRDKGAYNKIKDWVTSPRIMIHPKNGTPFMADNNTHWVQCSNDQEECPVFPGDTRITLIHVPQVKAEDKIAKPVLFQMLRKEAPDFLAAILSMELPESNDRLAVPTITTAGKLRAIEKNMSLLELFIMEEVKEAPGYVISAQDFHEQFKQWLDEKDRHYWTLNRVGRELPERFPRGRLSNNQAKHYGNMTFEPDPKPGRRWVLNGIFLKQEDVAVATDHSVRAPEGAGQGHDG